MTIFKKFYPQTLLGISALKATILLRFKKCINYKNVSEFLSTESLNFENRMEIRAARADKHNFWTKIPKKRHSAILADDRRLVTGPISKRGPLLGQSCTAAHFHNEPDYLIR